MKKTQRRERAIARTREDILEAAARAFIRAGFQSATMRDIAQEAGYTAASLYTYFRDKQEILEGLVKLAMGTFQQVFEEPMPPGLGFRQRFELLLSRMLDQAERRREMFVLVFTLARADWHPRSKTHDEAIEIMGTWLRRLSAWFAENATARELGNHDPDDVAHFFSGITNSFLGEWIVHGALEGQLRRRGQLIHEFFFNGVAAPGAAHETSRADETSRSSNR